MNSVHRLTDNSKPVVENFRCPVCGLGYTAGQVVFVCPNCQTIYHCKCFSYMGNKCAVHGCNIILPDKPAQSQEANKALQAELARRYRNLAILKEQSSRYGIETPLYLMNQILDQEERIGQIEIQLCGGESGIPSLAEQYFSSATRALLRGDLWEAKRWYEMTLSEDEFYPRAKEMLDFVNSKLERTRVSETKTGFPPIATRNIGAGCFVVAVILIFVGTFLGSLIGTIIGALGGVVGTPIFTVLGAAIGVILAIIVLYWLIKRN